MPLSATKDIQLSVFQVKISDHILLTNVALHTIEIKDLDRCHLCAFMKSKSTSNTQLFLVLSAFY